MDEQTLRAIFDDQLQDVAKKSGLQEVQQQQQLCGQDRRLQALEEKWNDTERRLTAAEKAATGEATRAPGRTSTGSRASTTSASSQASDARHAWMPKLIHVKGFAVWVCSAEQKLRKLDLTRVQQQILACAPERLRSHLEPMPGSALNHNVSFKVCGAPITDIADELDAPLQRRQFKIRNHKVRVMVETRPWSRKRYALWHKYARQLAARRREGVDCEPRAQLIMQLVLAAHVEVGGQDSDRRGRHPVQRLGRDRDGALGHVRRRRGNPGAGAGRRVQRRRRPASGRLRGAADADRRAPRTIIQQWELQREAAAHRPRQRSQTQGRHSRQRGRKQRAEAAGRTAARQADPGDGGKATDAQAEDMQE